MSYINSIVDILDVDSGHYRVGMIVYNSRVRMKLYLDEMKSRETIKKAITNAPYSHGNTNTADALRSARQEIFNRNRGDRVNVRNIAILFMDGYSNVNRRMTIPEAKLLKDAGVSLYVIGIGLRNTREVDGMASQPLAVFKINVEGFNRMPEINNDLFDGICISGNN